MVCSVNSNGIKLLLFGSFCPHFLCFRDKLIRFWVYCCAFVDFYSRLLLSGEICAFAHVTSDFFFATSKVTEEAEILIEGFSLIFCRVKLLPDGNKPIYIVRPRKRVMS